MSIAGVIMLISAAQAHADVLPIVCTGSLDTYNTGQRITSAINAGGYVDPEHMQIRSPIGDFVITRVTPEAYRFDSNGPETLQDGTRVTRSGSLDRLSGRMFVIWLYVDKPSQAAMATSLICRPGQQLF